MSEPIAPAPGGVLLSPRDLYNSVQNVKDDLVDIRIAITKLADLQEQILTVAAHNARQDDRISVLENKSSAHSVIIGLVTVIFGSVLSKIMFFPGEA